MGLILGARSSRHFSASADCCHQAMLPAWARSNEPDSTTEACSYDDSYNRVKH